MLLHTVSQEAKFLITQELHQQTWSHFDKATYVSIMVINLSYCRSKCHGLTKLRWYGLNQSGIFLHTFNSTIYTCSSIK